MHAHVFWGAAAISVAAVSWLFYRYLVPKGWREWTRAGIVQAFLIAFYADMYGFPVTLYLLGRLSGLDVAGNFWDGNLWVVLSGAPTVMLASMAAGYGVAFLGAGLVAVGWRAVYRASREGRLACTGPYALVRHPQYTGILLALFGEGVVHWPTVFSLAAFPLISIAYVLLARKEEKQLVGRFGEAYRRYQRQIPMFWPNRKGWQAIRRGEALSLPGGGRA